MSNYDHLQLRYSCFSEPSLVSRSYPRSLSLKETKLDRIYSLVISMSMAPSLVG